MSRSGYHLLTNWGYQTVEDRVRELIKQNAPTIQTKEDLWYKTGMVRATFYKVMQRKQSVEVETIASVLTPLALDATDERFYVEPTITLSLPPAMEAETVIETTFIDVEGDTRSVEAIEVLLFLRTVGRDNLLALFPVMKLNRYLPQHGDDDKFIFALVDNAGESRYDELYQFARRLVENPR